MGEPAAAAVLPVAVDVVLLTLGQAPVAAPVAGPAAAPVAGPDDPVDRPLLALVVRRRRAPFAGLWSLPGVRLREHDDLEAAAAASLEGAGMAGPRHLEQLATFGAIDRDPRGRIVSVSHLALVPEPRTPELPLPDIAAARPEAAWVPALDPPPLAFDHARILGTAVQRLRGKLTYSTVAYGLLPDTFTLSELQGVYEAVLGQPLDKRNFRKKVLSLGMVEATGEQRRGPHRPAQLHRFRRRGVVEVGDVIAP